MAKYYPTNIGKYGFTDAYNIEAQEIYLSKFMKTYERTIKYGCKV